MCRPCIRFRGSPENGFNGQGYNSFVVESVDLVHWTNPRLAMGFGTAGEFDFGGCVIGAYLYESYDVRAPRLLKKRDGKYWTLYGCYAKQGGYDEQFCSDGKVFRDGDHWVMFYFGVGRGSAHIMAAFSRDLLHWTSHPEPLYRAGGHPAGNAPCGRRHLRAGQ
jgi:beta-xylosidase